MARAIKHLKAQKQERKLMVVVTDGQIYGGEVNTIQSMMEGTGIRVVFIGIGISETGNYAFDDACFVPVVTLTDFGTAAFKRLADIMGLTESDKAMKVHS